MRRPSGDDLLMAALWLENNEGEANEQEPMFRVAAWLRHEVAARDARQNEDKIVKEIAMQSGASVQRARAVWRARQR